MNAAEVRTLIEAGLPGAQVRVVSDDDTHFEALIVAPQFEGKRTLQRHQLVYGTLGILLGLHMAMSQNHGQMPTHAHILVIGWVSFAIFGLFYSAHGHAVPWLLARLHFWLAQVSLAALVVGLFLLYSGQTQYEPVAALSSLGYATSFLIFAVAAIAAMRRAPG